jgi:type 1 glutamine amidotransferase
MKLRIAAFFRATILATAALALTATAAEPKKLLVVTVTTGFRHSSIPTAEKVLSKLAKESGAFTVDFVRQPEEKVKRPSNPRGDADDEAKAKFKAEMAKYEATQGEFQARVKEALSKLSAENLKSYDGLIFANTTGDLPVPDPQAIIDWVKDGHAFIGMHSASDTFHGFRPYVEMLGGEFLSHGAQASVDCINEDKKHPACSHLPQTWTVYDEIYILKNFERAKVHGLLTLDKEPNRKTPGDFPIAWTKEIGKGRLFYTSLGHREDVWDDETPANFKRQNSTEVAQAYQKHILGGIKWALRLEESSAKRRN